MNDRALFELVRTADPLRVAGIGEPASALLEQILRSAHSPRRSSRALTHRRWLVFVAAVVGLVALAAGLAIAAGGWLTGEPAPSAVVTDFQAHTPQLGFHPDPGSAVLVAQDGPIKLYATTDREGTYCLVLDEPWKPATTLDGGTCIPEAIASDHFIAGLVGASPQTGGQSTLVVGGRIADTNARAVRFRGPDDKVIERPVGPSGFFVAAVSTGHAPCIDRDWSSTFTAVDGDGKVLAQMTIPLTQTTVRSKRGVRACLLSFLRK